MALSIHLPLLLSKLAYNHKKKKKISKKYQKLLTIQFLIFIQHVNLLWVNDTEILTISVLTYVHLPPEDHTALVAQLSFP